MPSCIQVWPSCIQVWLSCIQVWPSCVQVWPSCIHVWPFGVYRILRVSAAGVLVIRPSRDTARRLFAAARTLPSYDGSDQVLVRGRDDPGT